MAAQRVAVAFADIGRGGSLGESVWIVHHDAEAAAFFGVVGGWHEVTSEYHAGGCCWRMLKDSFIVDGLVDRCQSLVLVQMQVDSHCCFQSESMPMESVFLP
jgi:hypothetical protein